MSRAMARGGGWGWGGDCCQLSSQPQAGRQALKNFLDILADLDIS